ncbi:uncharacterized protein LOC127374814 isoform X2 [Dicentrarchus labrax]|uniref:uncharacterized protein LOC127374814 isoform X2 n=1 Tax=Dicentrarchus labrax TaxID=13489 RepID=UPI0021F61A9F|nr:uncharacterized protein LOC127374814 isoform X2 [Dicentrarchus labrax]
MKNFSIQSFSVMMMIVVVYAASLSQHQSKRVRQKRSHDGCTNASANNLRHLIHEDANLMLHNMTEEENSEMIPWITGLKTCVKEFSCLAEKALNQSKNHKLKRLTHHLHQYNKLNETDCHLKEHPKCTVHRVLEDIKTCIVKCPGKN